MLLTFPLTNEEILFKQSKYEKHGPLCEQEL